MRPVDGTVVIVQVECGGPLLGSGADQSAAAIWRTVGEAMRPYPEGVLHVDRGGNVPLPVVNACVARLSSRPPGRLSRRIVMAARRQRYNTRTIELTTCSKAVRAALETALPPIMNYLCPLGGCSSVCTISDRNPVSLKARSSY